MKLFHIVAASDNGVIGKDNKLPWHFSCDLKRFKELTLGNTIIMGRKTFESIGRKPLPGRENFVLSHSASQHTNGEHLRFFQNVGEALKSVNTEKAYIIGGASLYQQTIDQIDGIYLTAIKARFEGDAYYPFYPKVPAGFREVEKQVIEEKDTKLEFIFLENKENQ